jgi:uncharacterized protein (TIRG00374 family)
MTGETEDGVVDTSRTGQFLRDHGVELTVVFGGVVLIALTIASDAEAVAAALRSFDWWALVVVIALTTGGFAFRYLKWEFYLRHLDIRVPSVRSVLVFVSGLMMVLTPAKGGGVWKGWLLNESDDVQISRIVSVVIAERATDLLALCALASLGIALSGRSAVVVGAVVGVFLAIIGLVQWRSFCLRVLDLVRAIPLLGRFADSLETAYQDSYALFQLRPLAISLLLSLAAWTTEGMSLWVVLRGLGDEPDPFTALSVFGTGSVVGGASMLPGGFGAAEASIAGLLVALGYDSGTAASATIIVRIGTLWYGAAFGTLGYAVYKLRRRVNDSD